MQVIHGHCREFANNGNMYGWKLNSAIISPLDHLPSAFHLISVFFLPLIHKNSHMFSFDLGHSYSSLSSLLWTLCMLAFHTPSTVPPQALCTCCARHLEYFCASSSPFGSQFSIPSSRKSFLTLPLPLQAGNSRSSLGFFALFLPPSPDWDLQTPPETDFDNFNKSLNLPEPVSFHR